MSSKHQEPVVIGRYPTEFEASLIRNLLVEEGIPSQVVGGMTAGFRAETPGMVEVLVPGDRAEEARLILETQEDMEDADDVEHQD
ncbi:MAG: DUF2007 domain-containing protein [Phycisphaerales bacterium]|nr:DUF2007 domain-containing protein [Phycisphaerales bacterium]